MDSNSKKSFTKKNNQKSIPYLRFFLIAILIGSFPFAYIDIGSLPSNIAFVWIIRFAIFVPLLIIGILLTYTNYVIKLYQTIISIIILVLGFGVIAMIFVSKESDPAFTTYYVGLILIQSIGIGMRLRFRNTLIIILLFDISYVLIAVFKQNLIGADVSPDFHFIFYNNIAFLFTCGITILITSYTLEELESTNFDKNEQILSEKLIIENQNEDFKNLNQQLQFQSNLYTILNITSKNKILFFVLQEVLDQILNIDSLNVQHKGLIFLTNEKGELQMVADRNVDSLLKTCSVIKKGQCLCGEVLKNKTKIYCDSVGHNHTIIPEGMTPHGHYVIPILSEDEVLGVINIYIKQGEPRNEKVEQFLEAVADILARKILVDRANEKIVTAKYEFQEQGKQLSQAMTEQNDSIKYAQFLQKSLMPNQETINHYFKDSSFWFKPKDKVSGDLYFAHEVENTLYFGVGDCTGHGIPGSILSAMSVEAVKTVLTNSDQKKPDEILNTLRTIAKVRFSVNLNEKRSDAMDAALCMFNRDENKLYYAGGFINLFIIRNNREFIEYKATKCPIGSYPIEYDFELHEIDLLEGDVVYLSTDGYVDQFGIDKNANRTKQTKFKSKRFRELLLSIAHLSCNEQANILKQTSKEWKGDIEQTDDITVFIARH